MTYLWRFLKQTPLSILLYRIFTYPFPYRIGLARLWFTLRPRTRPHYYACMLEAALLARALDHRSISVLEFGVASGNGLLAMERYAEKIQRRIGIEIALYGFDMGDQGGLPATTDPRDMPYLWPPGAYKMDFARLKARLRRAELRLGNVAETVPAFAKEAIAPIAAVFIDVDYYSSTMEVLKLFDLAKGRTLPRVVCYFDDVDVSNTFNGELAAIIGFNASHSHLKIARVDSHHTAVLYGTFNNHVFHLHDFEHPAYNRYIPGGVVEELPL